MNGWRTRRHNACRDALQEEARGIRKGDGSLLREVNVAEGLNLEIKRARGPVTSSAGEARGPRHRPPSGTGSCRVHCGH